MSDAHDPPDIGDPPEPPNLPRRVRIYQAQGIGLSLLFLLPVLALMGLFGESRGRLDYERGDLQITVDHPTRIRAGLRTDVAVYVTNRSDEPIRDVSITWDPSFLQRFADVQLVPSGPDQPELLFELPPGEERIVRIEFEGGKLWRHRGQVAITTGTADTIRLEIGTFVFP